MTHEQFEAFRNTETYFWLFTAAFSLSVIFATAVIVIGIPALVRRVLFGVWFWAL